MEWFLFEHLWKFSYDSWSHAYHELASLLLAISDCPILQGVSYKSMLTLTPLRGSTHLVDL